jgi:hypothetical protein
VIHKPWLAALQDAYVRGEATFAAQVGVVLEAHAVLATQLRCALRRERTPCTIRLNLIAEALQAKSKVEAVAV